MSKLPEVSLPLPAPGKEVDGDISTQHKALLQFEKNVEKNDFDIEHEYNYPDEGKEYAIVYIKSDYAVEACKIHYYFGRLFCYEVFLGEKSVMWTNTLRDVKKLLNSEGVKND